MNITVLVTGGAGYIGSHAVVELLNRDYKVIVIDSLENGFLKLIDKRVKFYHGDIQDSKIMDKIFIENKVDVVMHFAAYIKVSESVEKPNKYYLNNTYSTICLLESMKKHQVKNIIFSSTAAVYGEAKGNEFIDESCEMKPINPYGNSKKMSEEIIQDNAKSDEIRYAIFRYFNVAGAHPFEKIGQMDNEVTALIPSIMKSVLAGKVFYVFGSDYSTKDGTAIRDYIHVMDLVLAHILAIPFLLKGKSGVFNLGSESGFSVLEIIELMEKVIQQKIKYKVKTRREGDSECVVASNKKARKLLGWQPRYTLEDILKSAWNWRKDDKFF